MEETTRPTAMTTENNNTAPPNTTSEPTTDNAIVATVVQAKKCQAARQDNKSANNLPTAMDDTNRPEAVAAPPSITTNDGSAGTTKDLEAAGQDHRGARKGTRKGRGLVGCGQSLLAAAKACEEMMKAPDKSANIL